MEKIKYILNLFGVSVENITFKKINSGHINRTYIIASEDKKYILQCINRRVFKNPEEIMSNIRLVTNCLKEKVHCPEFLKYNSKNYIIYDSDMWRIYPYIENSVSYISLEDTEKIREFGRVTGQFHKLTESLDTSDFFITVKNFHNTKQILNSVIILKNENYINEYTFFEKMTEYEKELTAKSLSERIVHNDVKCSNALFDKTTHKAVTLIDLDTVMPGLVVYDFGDGVRSACVTDNAFDLSKFKAFCRGYFSESSIESPENYFLGIICITAELAARYFADFIKNENYFADKTADEKLLRTNELIKLSESIIENREKIINIIKECL